MMIRAMPNRNIRILLLVCILWTGLAADHPRHLRAADPPADSLRTPPKEWDSSANTLSDLLRFDTGDRVTTKADWQRRREQLRAHWLAFFGTGPGKPPALGVEIVERSQQPDHQRQLIRYAVEPDVRVDAYLLLPEKPHPNRPGIVVLHPTTDGTIRHPVGLYDHKKKGSHRLGLHLVRRGYAVICPENYLWIKGKCRLKASVDELFQRYPKWNGMAKMTWDASRAVDVLIQGRHCDPRRIGCIGHSLGAKEVLYLAAFDERIAAAVSSDGGIGLTFSNWHDPWYLGPRIKDPNFGRENHEVLALVAPRPFLLLAGQSADGDKSWAFIERALDVYKLLEAEDRIGWHNHRQGHAIPPDARRLAFAWLDKWLTR